MRAYQPSTHKFHYYITYYNQEQPVLFLCSLVYTGVSVRTQYHIILNQGFGLRVCSVILTPTCPTILV